MSLHLFEARALAATVRFLDAHGYQAGQLLDRLRIPNQMIKQGGWVSIDQFYKFAAASALRVGCREAILQAELSFFCLDHLGPISPAMRSCKTVKESLELATRMACHGYQGCRYFVDIRGDTTWLSFSNPRLDQQSDKFVDDITLGVFIHLIRFLIGDGWQPERLQVQDRSVGRHRSISLFKDCQFVFNPHVSGVAFPTDFLSRRVFWSHQEKGFGKSNTWEWPPEDGESFSDALYRLLASHFRHDQIPNRDRAASIIGVSPATMKRRLGSVGMTYRGLVDRLRFDAACEMLSIPQMSVKDIAAELGYSGTNNFVRSFRRMTGMTPGQFRHHMEVKGQSIRPWYESS